MKKVRGRVVQRQPGDQLEQESTQPHPFFQNSTTATDQNAQMVHQNTYEQGQREVARETHGKRTEIFNYSAEEKRQTNGHASNAAKSTVETASVYLKYQVKKEQEVIQSTSIQAPSEGKAGQVKNSEEQRKSRIEQLKNKYLKKNAEVKIEPIKVVQTVKEVVQQPPKSVIVPNPPRIQKEEKVEIIIQAKNSEVVQPIKGPREEIVQKSELKKEVIQKQQEIPPQTQQPIQNIPVPVKLEEKRQGRVPPPPPIARNLPKTKLPPEPVPKEVEQPKQEPKEDITQPIQQKQQETSPEKRPQQPPIKNAVGPPPPRNKAPRSIAPPVIPTKQVRKVQEVIPTSQPSQPLQSQVKSQPFSNPLVSEPKQQPKQSTSLSLQQQINLWITSPSTFLSSLPGINQLLLGSDFTFTSSNPHFNSTLATFISEFALKSKGELSTEQKLALYNFSLEYFQNSTGQLTSELLLILAKLGSSYLSKYSVENINRYTKDLMLAKTYFTNEELNVLIGFLLDQKEVNDTQLLHLLLIFPTERLVSILCSKNLSHSSEILPFLAAIQLQKKDFALLLPVYLKLIGTLVENIPRDQSVIEKILKHVSELQMNEKCYQLHKQLKLKLINILSKDEAPQRQEARPAKVETKEEKSDGGLRGYWNKAVDTLKTATTQLVDLKQSVNNPPKQEKQEEQELTYDPVLKRWLINGKVPDDQTEKPSDPTAPKAPPPPPPKAGNKPTPPPLPAKKGRVATNRYA